MKVNCPWFVYDFKYGFSAYLEKENAMEDYNHRKTIAINTGCEDEVLFGKVTKTHCGNYDRGRF